MAANAKPSKTSSSVQMATLLILSDEGAALFRSPQCDALANLGAPAFACAPDQFLDLMAAALSRADISQWAARHEIVTATC